MELGIERGELVLAPALICRSAIEPMISIGIRVEFVDVTTDLEFQDDALEAAFERYRPKALLVVHYFGSVPHLEKYHSICKEYGALLIEDRCHGFPVIGSGCEIKGVAAIYSLRKFLPVPDGGLLLLKTERKEPVQYGHRRRLEMSKFIIRHFLERTIFQSGINSLAVLDWVKGALSKIRRSKGISSSPHFDLAEYRLPLSGPSSFLAKWLLSEDLVTIPERRRFNHERLSALLPGEAALHSNGRKLRSGVVPMAFPIRNLSQRQALIMRLRRAGIGAYPWPGRELPSDVDQQRFPVAAMLARQLVLLPVHQDLDDADLTHMASVVLRENSREDVSCG